MTIRRQLRVLILAALAAVGLDALGAGGAGPERFSPPGVYGLIDVSRYPNPETVATKPVMTTSTKTSSASKPLYLWIPRGHRTNWVDYCSRYSACERPAYFVSDEWYYHRGPGKGLPSGHDHNHDHD